MRPNVVLALAATSGFHLSGCSEGLFEDNDNNLADDPLRGSGECGQNGNRDGQNDHRDALGITPPH